MCRREGKSDVKIMGLTHKVRPKLFFLRIGEVMRIPGVAVKCAEIGRNTGGEGELLDDN